MAKVVCNNCGHKNPSSAASCSNCGSFLVDDVPKNNYQPVSNDQPEEQVQDSSPSAMESGTELETVETQPYNGPVETVKVPGGNSSQWLGMLSGFAVLGAFLVMQYMGVPLPSYSIYIFLALIFVLPTLLRRSTSSIRYNPAGFSIPDKPELAPVSYENIMDAKLGLYSRYEQSVTLHFKNSDPALKMDFTSMMNFRTFIVSLNRRRIPLLRENAAPNAEQQPSS